MKATISNSSNLVTIDASKKHQRYSPISGRPTYSTSSSFSSSSAASCSTTSRSNSSSYSSASAASSSSIAAVAVAVAPSRRVSPSSPLTRLAGLESSSSSSGASSGSRGSTSSLQQQQRDAQKQAGEMHDASMMVEGMASKEQRQRVAAFESQMKSLYELEYRDEVLVYMAEMETQTMASVELIDMQPELAWYMRPYLVDFLIEIHAQYRLRPETLYLAINIVDRYVSKRIVYKKHYQLVGCAALWIAAKFEDAKDRVPSVEDLCAVCCAAYDQSAFIQMEGHVLSTINWCLGHPTSEAWLRIACSPGPTVPMEEQRTQHLARFIMEITLFHRAFVSIKPSDIALSCLLLARFMCESEKLVGTSERAEVVKIAQMLDAHLAEHLEQVSATVVKKYSPSFYSRASSYAREWYLSGRRFHYPSSSSFAASSSPSSRLQQHQPSSAVPEIEMMTSSSSSSPISSRSSSATGRGDSEFDEQEEEEEEEEMCSSESEPVTPTTSVGSGSSDPFDAITLHPTSGFAQKQQQMPYHSQQKHHQQQLLAAPTGQAHPMPAGQQHGQQSQNQGAGMQWQMQVVPPSAEQSSYRSA